MSRISAFALTSYGCNKAKLLSIPYTWESREHWWNFASSDLTQEFLSETQEIGLPICGVFYGEEGFRHFFTVKPVSGIADLKGMRPRYERYGRGSGCFPDGCLFRRAVQCSADRRC